MSQILVLALRSISCGNVTHGIVPFHVHATLDAFTTHMFTHSNTVELNRIYSRNYGNQYSLLGKCHRLKVMGKSQFLPSFLLPTTYVVSEKVMFSVVSFSPQVWGGGGRYPTIH